MKKKIIIGILSFVILITGIIGFARLRYWERSIWIFKTSEQSARGGRFERGDRGGREFRSRPGDFGENGQADFRSLPDSVQQRMMTERGTSLENDSLRQARQGAFPDERSEFRARRPENDGRRGHDFRRGNDIQMGNVGWFLAVFSLITLATIFLDQLNRRFGKRKKQEHK